MCPYVQGVEAEKWIASIDTHTLDIVLFLIMESTDEIEYQTVFVDSATDSEEILPKNKGHRFKVGNPGGPGRPKGTITMKEFARKLFLELPDEEKIAYIKGIEEKRPGFAWTMSEGNPTEDRNIKITVPTPILGGVTQLSLEEQHRLQEANRQALGAAVDDSMA